MTTNYMKAFITIAGFLSCFLSTVFAQNAGKISGSIISKNEKISGATISLLRAKDSSVVKLSAANKEGLFVFEQIKDGKYLVSVTAVGHQKSYSNIFELNPQQQTVQIPAVNLIPVSKSLSDVAVTARRPLIEQKIDRTIVN